MLKKDSSLFFFIFKLDFSILFQNSNFMLHKLSNIYILQPMELIQMFRDIFCINRILRLMHSSLNDKNGYGKLGYPYEQWFGYLSENILN